MKYFHQWQYLPVDVKTWQCSSRVTENPLYLFIADYVCTHGSSILDVGCGIAHDNKYYRDYNYVGVDVTPKFIVEAHKCGSTVSVASALDLPFPNQSFDTVYANSLLVHMPPQMWKTCLCEMLRVAAKQVITIEGKWKSVTSYVIGERYPVKDELLEFYNNAYGSHEVREYMLDLGVKEIRVYYDESHTQATIYSL